MAPQGGLEPDDKCSSVAIYFPNNIILSETTHIYVIWRIKCSDRQ